MALSALYIVREITIMWALNKEKLLTKKKLVLFCHFRKGIFVIKSHQKQDGLNCSMSLDSEKTKYHTWICNAGTI